MEAVEHRRLDGANVDTLQHRQLDRLAALDAQRQQPDVEQLVVCVDTESSLGSALRRRAGPAAAPDSRKVCRAYEPLRRGAHTKGVVVHQERPIGCETFVARSARRGRAQRRIEPPVPRCGQPDVDDLSKAR